MSHASNWQAVDTVQPVPREQARQGVFWLQSLYLQHVVTPNRELSARVRALKNRLGFHAPVIGMHVRHGDSCFDSNRKSLIPRRLVPTLAMRAS